MRKAHKNSLFLAINNSKYPITDFEFDEKDDCFTIYYKPLQGKFYYSLQGNKNDFDFFLASAIEFRPDFPERYRLGGDSYSHIERIKNDFIDWLDSDVKSYLEDQSDMDLWEEYIKGSSLLQIEQPNIDDTGDFTSNEKQQIRAALNDLRLNIPQQFNIPQEQISNVNDKFDYLIDAVERLNKTDWKGILIAQYFSLITTLALNPDQAKNLYGLFIKVLHIIPLLNK